MRWQPEEIDLGSMLRRVDREHVPRTNDDERTCGQPACWYSLVLQRLRPRANPAVVEPENLKLPRC